MSQSTAGADPGSGDVLSDLFDLVEVQGLLTGGFAARGAWVSEGTISQPLKLIALVAGSARVTADGPGGPSGPLELAPGDVVLLNQRTRLELRGGPEGPAAEELFPAADFDSLALEAADTVVDDIVIGGRIEISRAGLALLGSALPGVVHVRSVDPSGARVAGLVARLFEEASSGRLGSAFALRQNGQLLLLEVLRAYLEREHLSASWMRLVTDAPLAPALRLIHDQVGRRLTLDDLARAAGMSRTTFAERFRAVSGTPPLTYLTRWRMLLAQRALRDPDVRLTGLAADLGYGSESAFSTAFKRETGLSPLHYRRELRSTSSSSPTSRVSPASRASPAPGSRGAALRLAPDPLAPR